MLFTPCRYMLLMLSMLMPRRRAAADFMK